MSVIDIHLGQVKLYAAELIARPEQIDRALQRAVRNGATEVRREELVALIQRVTGIKRKKLNDRIGLRFSKPTGAAGRGREHVATITPSAKGIEVSEFSGLTLENVDSTGTRARVLVNWPVGGKKVAAGYANPRGSKKMPLRTRSRKGKFNPSKPALAASVASMVKDIDGPQFRDRVADRVSDRFDIELQKEISK